MKIIRTLREWPRSQRGQILVIVGGGMVVILGLVALSTDVGTYLRDLRNAQNDVDAAALAGAQELMSKPPDGTEAIQKAEDWAANNDAAGQVDWSIDCGTTASGESIPAGLSDSNGDDEPDTICVGLRRTAPAFFARVLGITDFPVKRAAAARVVHSAGGNVCPFALKSTDTSDFDASDGTYLGVEIGKIYEVKAGAGSAEWGNFGILKLYPTGADSFKEALASGCQKNPTNVVLEGEVVETGTETGVVGNPTLRCLGTDPPLDCPGTGQPGFFTYELSDGIQDAQGYGWCDVPMNWIETDDSWWPRPSGYDPNDEVRLGCEGRKLMLPIVDKFPPSGSSTDITILGVAAVYFTGWGHWDPDAGVAGEYDRSVPPAQVSVYVEFLEDAYLQPKDLIGVGDNPLAPLRLILIR